MKPVVAGIGLLIILVILLEAFETIVLPRRVSRRFRLTRIFYRSTWIPWSALARRISSSSWQEAYLGFYGPLSLILLIGVWVVGLIMGFAILQWATSAPLSVPEQSVSFFTYLYLSGTTFFTLGLGDVTPQAPLGRALTIIEPGVGFGFLALIIGYLPVIYQAFSRREVNISLLDARAGSPPSAGELLTRNGQNLEELGNLLRDWEHWSADLLESHLSYHVLCYFRSQHNDQSWLTALTAILDTSALVIVGIDGASKRQAHLTFAMARRVVVDLAQVFNSPPPRVPVPDRLPSGELSRLHDALAASGSSFRGGSAANNELFALRQLYEPYVNSLSDCLLMALPPLFSPTSDSDNWEPSVWKRTSKQLPTGRLDPRTIKNYLVDPELATFQYRSEDEQ
jgi:hypothetical protein